MEPLLLIIPVLLSLLILAAPSRWQYACAVIVTLILVAISSAPALEMMADPSAAGKVFRIHVAAGSLSVIFDSLSSFFVLIVNFTALTGLLYSHGYLRPYRQTKSPVMFSLHYFFFYWLHLSMLAVLTLREGTAFLIAWELMAVSSFMLILFEAEKRKTLKTAVNYLIQMHVGMVFLLVAFLVTEQPTGLFGFDALIPYFHQQPGLGVFFLFFAGFAIKAGFIPFHTWLPESHPAAPSHVSGVMSGVMIKMGIYGILRVLTCIRTDLTTIGSAILVLSALTALYGILMSVVQTDLKKLLAYSTIENAGIIGIGIGLGALGLGTPNPTLVLLGFGGALFHVLNHSLFKSLLFFSAGSVYTATHTRQMDALGGLIRRMPVTAGLFLTGSVAICALPPLNGFFSELVIYYGLFAGMQSANVFQTIGMMMLILVLALVGGLALFGFTRAFGITFLGSPRTDPPAGGHEMSRGMLVPKIMIAGMILAIGLAPLFFLRPLLSVTGTIFDVPAGIVLAPLTLPMLKITLVSLILTFLVILLLFIRMIRSQRVKPAEGPTWGCGYTAGTVRQQYTASSYAANIAELAGPFLRPSDEMAPIREETLFPEKRSFRRGFRDAFSLVLNRLTAWSMQALKNIARLQTGYIQHYILYAFIFILFIFALLYLQLI